MFALKNVNSTARLDLPANKCLFAGVEEISMLFIQFGTKSKKVLLNFFKPLNSQNNVFVFQVIEKIRLYSTPGLTFCSEDKTEFCSEVYIDCPKSINSSNSVSLPIKLFAQLPPLKDHPRTVHHKVICSKNC